MRLWAGAILAATLALVFWSGLRAGPPVAAVDVGGTVQAGRPVVILLGGSEGGRLSADHPLVPALEAAGFSVLRVGYFGTPGTPPALDRIALSPFDDLIDGLPEGCTFAAGVSKGAELALLLAARNDRLRGVAAVSPAHVVFQASRITPFRRSSWRDGDALPFVPYPRDLRAIRDALRGDFLDIHRRALADRQAVAAATIPVERINGPVLLVSATRDQVWPSQDMARAIENRLTAQGFAHPLRHVTFVHDHFLLRAAAVRTEVVIFLTAAAQNAACLPRPTR